MCREMIDKALNAIMSLEATIEFLEKNRENLVNIIISKILDSKKIYLYEFKTKQQEFIESIMEGHFQWMIDYSQNPNINFNDKYMENEIHSLNIVYCDFFNFFKEYLEKIDIHIEVKEVLEDYSDFFLKRYCY